VTSLAEVTGPKLLVTGSRAFAGEHRQGRDLLLTRDGVVADELLSMIFDGHPQMTLVHGGCPKGADAWAKDWAYETGNEQVAVPAKWQRPDGSTDRGAGFKRNAEMVSSLQPGDFVVAMWDWTSNGTNHCVGEAVKRDQKLVAAGGPDNALRILYIRGVPHP
jgi:hypothetical protein